MWYLDLQTCGEQVFPFIHHFLSANEPAPQYEVELRGIQELEKVLDFVQDDQFYPSFQEKAAYLICSIAGSQYFSNGNKRLGVASLLFFLVENAAEWEALEEHEYGDVLSGVFSGHVWERNSNIPEAQPLFLYNLALVIGDRSKWGTNDFSVLKEKVATIFQHLYRIP
jgi:prophage maintenance system killer protein